MGYKMKRGAAPKFKDLGSSAPTPGDSPLEKFDWGAALSGGAKGAKMGSMAGPWGTAIGAIGGGLLAGFKGGKEQEEQEALAEAEQLEETEKNDILAKLAVEKKRESVGYSGFDSESS